MTTSRRAFLIALSLAISGLLLRPQLSSALVTRGDTLAYYGHPAQALITYRRALAFDARNDVAADRYVFGASISRDERTLRTGLEVANRFLKEHPASAAVRMDRALCLQHLGELSAAAADFADAAKINHDPRALMFAALDERRLHNIDRERALLRQAIKMDDHFSPASMALARASR